MKTILIALALACTVGCTYLAPKKLKQEAALAQTQAKILDQAKYWNDTTVNSLAHETNNSLPIQLAKKSSTQAQIMLGAHPTERFDVDAFFASNSAAIKELTSKIDYDKELLKLRTKQESKLETTENKLQVYGQIYEEERNKTIWWKFWTWSTATLIIAGIVCVCVFTPLGPVVINNLLSFLWSVVPRVASFFKAIPATVVDNIVKGNEEFKLKAQSTPVALIPSGHPDNVYNKDQVEEMIKADREKLLQNWKDELAKATNDTDKNIIEQRKTVLNYV